MQRAERSSRSAILSVKIRDNTREALDIIRGLSGDALLDFTKTATEVTKQNAPVRKNVIKKGKKKAQRGGNHKSLIAWEETGRRFKITSTRLFSGSGYGAYLEFGTHKMAARPHFSRGIHQAISEFKDGEKWRRGK